MQTLKLRAQVDQNGLLQIQLPDCRDEELEILVVYQPVSPPEPVPKQWPEGVLNAFGAWQGEPLSRAPQGEQPERDALR